MSSIEIAFTDSRPSYFSPRNIYLIDHMEDKLTRDQVLLKRSNSNNTSPGPTLSYNPILTPIPILTLAFFDELFK